MLDFRNDAGCFSKLDDLAGLEDLVAGFGDRFHHGPPEAILIRQVHGRHLVMADDLAPGEHREIGADALVCTRPGTVVAVRTADCVPVLLAARRGAAGSLWAAAIHAGWRGTVADVVGAAIGNAVEHGHAPDRLVAALGPSIGPCCYEIGEEVAERFRTLDIALETGASKPRVNLVEANRTLLVRAGVCPQNILVAGQCTRCSLDRYHSHRAAPGERGRQRSWIGWRRGQRPGLQ